METHLPTTVEADLRAGLSRRVEAAAVEEEEDEAAKTGTAEVTAFATAHALRGYAASLQADAAVAAAYARASAKLTAATPMGRAAIVPAARLPATTNWAEPASRRERVAGRRRATSAANHVTSWGAVPQRRDQLRGWATSAEAAASDAAIRAEKQAAKEHAAHQRRDQQQLSAAVAASQQTADIETAVREGDTDVPMSDANPAGPDAATDTPDPMWSGPASDACIPPNDCDGR